MNYNEILDALAVENPEALLLEPRSMYDPCVVGMTSSPDDHWDRKPGFVVAVYDANKCIEAIVNELVDEDSSALVNDDIWSVAVEHFEFNTSGAWVGQNTPTFRYEKGEE
jgi:hypothetical protein